MIAKWKKIPYLRFAHVHTYVVQDVCAERASEMALE